LAIDLPNLTVSPIVSLLLVHCTLVPTGCLHLDTPAQLVNRAYNASLLRLVDSFRIHGHRAATIDPLDLLQREEIAALNPSRYALDDPNKTYNVDGILWTGGLDNISSNEGSPGVWLTLDQIVHHLHSVYTGRISFEYMHSPYKSERLWWSHLLESLPALSSPSNSHLDDAAKKRVWGLMARSETFDHFLQEKFPSLKRYGLEGAESMLPALDTLFHVASNGE
jgi:2-oxoadipate dehydrogenase E1 component